MAKFMVLPSDSGDYGFDLEQVLHFKIETGSSYDFELSWHQPYEFTPMKLTLYFKNRTDLVIDNVEKRFIDKRFLPALEALEESIVEKLRVVPAVKDFKKNSGVYFIQGEITKRIKIGHSQDIASRLKSLQASEHLRLIYVIPDATPQMEADLHKKFSHLRIIGEWFDGSQEIVDYINTLRVKGKECIEKR